LRPSAAAAEALALAEEREDFREAEDTIFGIESGAWEVLGTMSESRVGSRNEDRARDF
jgi:hypothetical protein